MIKCVQLPQAVYTRTHCPFILLKKNGGGQLLPLRLKYNFILLVLERVTGKTDQTQRWM